ncbi:MAG: hypothetical protein D4R50_03055, partial [Actinomycetales bacterium]
PGTILASAVNPPLALLVATLAVDSILGRAGLHPTKIGLELITSLAALAPYLILGALISWGFYFAKSRK